MKLQLFRTTKIIYLWCDDHEVSRYRIGSEVRFAGDRYIVYSIVKGTDDQNVLKAKYVTSCKANK